MTEKEEAAVRRNWKTWTATLSVAASFFMGCGTWIGNPKGSSSPPTGGGSSGSGFPVDLMLSSPTGQETAVGLSLAAAPVSQYKARKEKLSALLNSKVKSECTFDLKIERDVQNVSCFGPELFYRHHPDGTDRNHEVDPATGLYSLPPGDIGIASALMPGTGEACSSAQLNQKVEGIASQVNSLIYSLAAVHCVANSSGKSLPKVGAKLDLTKETTAAFANNRTGLSIVEAWISHVASTEAGKTVYETQIRGSSDSKSITISLKHEENDAKNLTYHGKLTYTISSPTDSDTSRCPQGDSGKMDATSITYQKVGESVLMLELKSAKYCNQHADPYVSAVDHTVDPAKKFSGDATNGWFSHFNYALFNLNTATDEGDFQFAWQADPSDLQSRSINVSIGKEGEALLGTTYVGFGPDVAELNPGQVTGMICNWGGPAHDRTVRPFAQRQILRREPGALLFLPTESNIGYAPTNSCEYVAGSQTPGFEWGTSASVSGEHATQMNELSDVSAGLVGITVPKQPNDIEH